jgi:hypothetical protein
VDPKSILASKTFWMNLVGVPVFAWLAKKGLPLDDDTQNAVIVLGISLANILMRAFTKQPVSVSGVAKAAPVILMAAVLASCAGFFGPTDATDTRSQQQIAFDDACWSVKTAEATFTAFNARGAVDAAGVAQFNTISAELDAACAGPLPTDTKQFAAKVLVNAASIVALAAPKAS